MDIDLSDIRSNDSVPLTSRDRRFFTELDHFMNTESTKVGDNPSKERFAIFRLAFERVNIFYLYRKEMTKFLSIIFTKKIIDKSFLYRPLLRAIKQEYERCIDALESGADEVQTMTADLHRLVLQPKTFLLRQKRCMELEDKYVKSHFH
jgi:hypothetical protein